MYIRKIELTNYRNYKNLYINFTDKTNIFLGSNAQGKTNLLESIYLNSFGRSFKNIRDKYLVRFGEEFCRIKTYFNSYGEENTVEIIINREGRKGIRINGGNISKITDLIDRMIAVVFSPEDLRIVKDGPENRRRFLDRELSVLKTGYYKDILDYGRILKHRNSYLKNHNVDDDVLDVWDLELSSCGGRIIRNRKEFIEKTASISNEIHSGISGKKENLKIDYETSISDFEKAEGELYYLLKNNRKEDILRKFTSIGPHRDDLGLWIDQKDLRRFGSQGQQRTAALSLILSEIKMIEAEKNERPVLLLDDVLSELDNERQISVLNMLGDNQKFITTTDISGKVINNIDDGKVFKISDGEVEVEI